MTPRMVGSSRKRVTDDTDFLDGFILPLDGIVTGVYEANAFTTVYQSGHTMVADYAAPTGTPVAAPASGTVVLPLRSILLWRHNDR